MGHPGTIPCLGILVRIEDPGVIVIAPAAILVAGSAEIKPNGWCPSDMR